MSADITNEQLKEAIKKHLSNTEQLVFSDAMVASVGAIAPLLFTKDMGGGDFFPRAFKMLETSLAPISGLHSLSHQYMGGEFMTMSRSQLDDLASQIMDGLGTTPDSLCGLQFRVVVLNLFDSVNNANHKVSRSISNLPIQRDALVL
jgi:hypothetical protein